MDMFDPMSMSIPPLVRAGIDGFIRHGQPPGGFLRAVLENDLFLAFGRADRHSTRAMAAIVAYVYQHVPSHAYGSADNVRDWLALGGTEGLEREEAGQ